MLAGGRNLLPSRLNADGSGKRLADFLADPSAQTAKLKGTHVVGVRHYTTAGFRTVNNGLRDQTRFGAGQPHPLPVTVAFIKEALRRH